MTVFAYLNDYILLVKLSKLSKLSYTVTEEGEDELESFLDDTEEEVSEYSMSQVGMSQCKKQIFK